jgi:hypothetical protein
MHAASVDAKEAAAAVDEAAERGRSNNPKCARRIRPVVVPPRSLGTFAAIRENRAPIREPILPRQPAGPKIRGGPAAKRLAAAFFNIAPLAIADGRKRRDLR